MLKFHYILCVLAYVVTLRGRPIFPKCTVNTHAQNPTKEIRKATPTKCPNDSNVKRNTSTILISFQIASFRSSVINSEL